METGTGWIRLYRKVRENPLWQEKPFSKGQVWIDILLRAAFQKTNCASGSKTMTIEPGQLLISEGELARAWGWSRKKVHAFLKAGQERAQIRTHPGTYHQFVLTVVNWSSYQADDFQKNRPGNRRGTDEEPIPIAKPLTGAGLEGAKNVRSKEEKNNMSFSNALPDRNKQPDDSVRDVFEYWVQIMGKDAGRTRLTPERRTKIQARLNDGYTAEEIKQAVLHCSKSAYHMGQNEHTQTYNDLDLICRNGTKLEWFRDMKPKEIKAL